MTIALDTNVLVSGLLRSQGAPAAILRQLAAGHHHIGYDDRVIAEYERVLFRPRFGFDLADVRHLLTQLQVEGMPVVCQPLPARLPDPDDEKFVEIALAAGADYLVTGNVRHYPQSLCCGIRVVTPRAFVNL